MLEELTAIWNSRTLIFAFVLDDLKKRYVGSTIGFFWTVLNPLFELVIYTFVFSILLKVRFAPHHGISNYVLFLFCGIIPFLSIQESINRGLVIYTENSHLIKKVNFPVINLPIQIVLVASVNQVARIFILILAIFIMGFYITYHSLFILPIMLIQILFLLGLTLIFSTLQVYFRDLSHFIQAGLLAWMFITPIFYPASVFPRKFYPVLVLNPLAHLVGIYQELLLNHRLPNPLSFTIFTLFALLLSVLGFYIFRKYKSDLPDIL